MENATSNDVILANSAALREKIVRMLKGGTRAVRVHHFGDAVHITEVAPGETRDTDTKELPPPAVPSESTFEAKRQRLRLKLQLAERM